MMTAEIPEVGPAFLCSMPRGREKGNLDRNVGRPNHSAFYNLKKCKFDNNRVISVSGSASIQILRLLLPFLKNQELD